MSWDGAQHYGAFSELDPVDIGEETDAAEDHDLVVAGEFDPE